MNFHAYGNMLIRPFNYISKLGEWPTNVEAKFIDWYKQFGKDLQEKTEIKYGNAIEMVNYATDGEASDYMFGEKRIIAFSPELGSFNQNA